MPVAEMASGAVQDEDTSDEFMYETRNVVLNYLGLIPVDHDLTSSSSSSGKSRHSGASTGHSHGSSLYGKVIEEVTGYGLDGDVQHDMRDLATDGHSHDNHELDEPELVEIEFSSHLDDHNYADGLNKHGDGVSSVAKLPKPSSPARPTSLSLSPGPALSFQFHHKAAENHNTPSGDGPEIKTEQSSLSADTKLTDEISVWTEKSQAIATSSTFDSGVGEEPLSTDTDKIASRMVSMESVASSQFDLQSPISDGSSLSYSGSGMVDVRSLDWDTVSQYSHGSSGLRNSTEQPIMEIAAPLKEELDKEFTKTEQKYKRVSRQSSRISRTSERGDTRALSPESEVARRLNLISEMVMQQYGHRFSFDQAIAHLIDVPQDQMTYQLVRETLQHYHLLDGDLQGWPMVAILLRFSQKLTFSVLARGQRGIGRLVDHTTKLIFDTTADYILQQGGWDSVFEVDIAHNMAGCSEQSELHDGKDNQDQTDAVKCTDANEVKRVVGIIRQKSNNLKEDIERDRFKKQLQKYTMLAIGVALMGVAAGLMYRFSRVTG